MEEVEEKIPEEVKPKGRAAALEAYKAANPDLQEEPDDDALHDFHGNRYSELEGRHREMEGKYTFLGYSLRRKSIIFI